MLWSASVTCTDFTELVIGRQGGLVAVWGGGEGTGRWAASGRALGPEWPGRGHRGPWGQGPGLQKLQMEWLLRYCGCCRIVIITLSF